MASSLGLAWPVLVKVFNKISIIGGFSLEGFPHNIDVIAIWFNCLYYLFYFSLNCT